MMMLINTSKNNRNVTTNSTTSCYTPTTIVVVVRMMLSLVAHAVPVPNLKQAGRRRTAKVETESNRSGMTTSEGCVGAAVPTIRPTQMAGYNMKRNDIRTEKARRNPANSIFLFLLLLFVAAMFLLLLMMLFVVVNVHCGIKVFETTTYSCQCDI